ncbi:hypothetical protein ACS0TY_023888 [Phlomoides rotata]
MVDTGAYANILYRNTFERLWEYEAYICPCTHISGFRGASTKADGLVTSVFELISDCEPTILRARIMEFIIVDCPSTYKYILGRTFLNEYKVVVSTYHYCLKFPTNEGIGIVQGDQLQARECTHTINLKELNVRRNPPRLPDKHLIPTVRRPKDREQY